MHQCVVASPPGAVRETTKQWRSSVACKYFWSHETPQYIQVHPAAMLGPEIMPGPHFKCGYRKGHQIQDRPGALTPPLPQSPCRDLNQTFTGI